MTTEIQPLTTELLADKQAEAIVELAEAGKLRARGGSSKPGTRPPLLTTHERQKLCVAENVQRCPRCGAHVVTLFPSGGALCSACSAFFRSIDGGVRWFVDLVAGR